jgi:hypothetical protein
VLVAAAVVVVVPVAVVWLAAVCAACRSPNRFCEPRIAPRLDVVVDVVAVLLIAVFVLVEAAAVVDDVDADAELPLVTSDFVPPPPNDPETLRLPRNLGAINAANRSACTTPLTRMVRSRSPVVIVAVRTTTTFSWVAAFAPANSLATHATPARHTTPARTLRVRFGTGPLLF